MSRPLLADETPHIPFLQLEVRAAVGFDTAYVGAPDGVFQAANARLLSDEFFVLGFMWVIRVVDSKPCVVREIQHPVAVDLLV